MSLSPRDADMIHDATFGVEALKVVFKNMSDKLDGVEDYGDNFDVSYQGTLRELQSEISNMFYDAGVNVEKEFEGGIAYDNDGILTEISIYYLPENMDFTLTPDSTGYGISVEEIYDDDEYDDEDI